MMNNNRCLYCNTIIPEGMMVCQSCASEQIQIGTILQSYQTINDEEECDITEAKQ